MTKYKTAFCSKKLKEKSDTKSTAFRSRQLLSSRANASQMYVKISVDNKQSIKRTAAAYKLNFENVGLQSYTNTDR
jgi:hypothetical protein